MSLKEQFGDINNFKKLEQEFFGLIANTNKEESKEIEIDPKLVNLLKNL